MKRVRTFFIRFVALLLFALVSRSAWADTIFDSGLITFAASGTQFGRIARNGIPSDWSGPKPFPGVTGAPTSRAFEVFTVNSGNFPFLQISFSDPTVSFFDSAYLNSYNPVNSPPNYGLNVNYLGDPGLSEPFGVDASFFQIVVPTHTDIVIAVNELNPGGGRGKNFRFLVEGFYDTEYSDVAAVPEPASILLVGGGLAVLGIARWKKGSRGSAKILTRNNANRKKERVS